MFEQGFSVLFRAVERIRNQLESADRDLRVYLSEELYCLQRLGERYIDYWMTLDEQIQELFETYELDIPLENGAELSLYVDNQDGVPVVKSVPSSTQSRHMASNNSSGDMSSLDIEQFSLVPVEPMDVTLAFRRGMGYFDLAMFDRAAESLDKVVKEWGDPIARVYLAAAYVGQGKDDVAVTLLQELSQDQGDALLICAAQEVEAQMHLRRREFNEARECLVGIAERIPDYEDVWFNLAVCQLQLGNWSEAREAAQRCLSLAPDDVEAIHVKAMAEWRLRDFDSAIETCRKGLYGHPRHLGLVALAAKVESALGNNDKALYLCRLSTELRPEHFGGWSELAWTLSKHGEGTEAIAVIKRYLSTDPQHLGALTQLGVLLLLENDLRKSEQVLQKVVTRATDKNPLYIALGRIASERGQFAKAYKWFLRALRDPRKRVKQLGLYYYGRALYREGRFQEAEKYLKAAQVVSSSGDSAVLILLARVAERLGRPHEAEKLFARAERVGSSVRSTVV